MPGRGREVAVIVAFPKQLEKTGVYFRAVDLSVCLPRNMVPAALDLHHWAAEASVQRSLSSVLVDGTESSATGEIPPCCSPQVEAYRMSNRPRPETHFDSQ
jgi:hypothetical protein